MSNNTFNYPLFIDEAGVYASKSLLALMNQSRSFSKEDYIKQLKEKCTNGMRLCDALNDTNTRVLSHNDINELFLITKTPQKNWHTLLSDRMSFENQSILAKYAVKELHSGDVLDAIAHYPDEIASFLINVLSE